MSLTSANLVGYLRAEFSKSAKYRLRLFILQLAAAMPAAIAVLILDHNGNVLYALAFLSIALLALWWFVNAQYTRIRGAGQAALRGALLLGSLNETLPQSPSHCAIGFLSHPTLGSMGRVCSCRFGDEGAERIEIIPVDDTGKTKLGFRQFDMPDELAGWKFSAPESHKAYVDDIDTKLSGKVKPLIRLAKAWKFFRNVPVRSFYLEMRIAALMATEQVILYDIDLKNVLNTLWDDQLANVPDPRFPNDAFVLSACSSTSSRTDALSKLGNAATWSQQAMSEKHANRPGAAIGKWNLVYADRFPKYGA